MYLVESYKGGKDIKNFLKTIFIIILIFSLILISIIKFLNNGNLVKIGNIGILVVISGSMQETIKPDELIIIKEEKKYRENDIVTYIDDVGDLVTHRIVQINKNKIITKGDNNEVYDDEITSKEIIGKVIFHSIVLGYIYIYILKPIIIIIALIYIIEFIKWIFAITVFEKFIKKVLKNEDF